MEKEEKRKMRYSEDELNHIRATFSEDVLMFFRKVFFQDELSEADKQRLEVFRQNKEGLRLLRKTFLPEIESDSPLFEYADVFIGVHTADRMTEMVWLEGKMKEILEKFFDNQLKIIEGLPVKAKEVVSLKSLKFSSDKNPEQAHIDLGARNIILLHTDSMLQQLKTLARKEETPDEKVERQKKDSSK